LFSVIIPAFNEEKYLDACLKAVFNQRFPRRLFEVIVVDNNSTDNTAGIAKKYPVKLIKERQKGIIFAKQAGCKKAQGKIIAITDADTIVPANWLASINQKLETKNWIAITGPAVPQNLPLWGKIVYFLSSCWFIGWAKLKITPTIHGQNVAFFKKHFDSFGGFDTRLSMGEDELGLLYKLKKLGPVCYDPQLKVKTSGRRYQQGPWRWFKQIIWNYNLNFFLSRLAKKTVIPAYPDIR